MFKDEKAEKRGSENVRLAPRSKASVSNPTEGNCCEHRMVLTLQIAVQVVKRYYSIVNTINIKNGSFIKILVPSFSFYSKILKQKTVLRRKMKCSLERTGVPVCFPPPKGFSQKNPYKDR